MIKVLKIAFLLCISINFIGCFSYMREGVEEVTNEKNGAIPPSFGTDDNDILLCVLQDKEGYNKALKKSIKEQYHGKCEFIPKDKLDTPPYNDTKKYRYYLECMIAAIDYNGQTAVLNRDVTKQGYFYTPFVVDRNGNTIYRVKRGSANYDKLLNAYITNLELKRKK